MMDIRLTWCSFPQAVPKGSGTLYKILTELVVVSIVMDHFDVLEHAEIFDLLFPDGRAVVGDEDQLGFAFTDAALGGAVPQHGLPRLEDKSEFGVDCL